MAKKLTLTEKVDRLKHKDIARIKKLIRELYKLVEELDITIIDLLI